MFIFKFSCIAYFQLNLEIDKNIKWKIYINLLYCFTVIDLILKMPRWSLIDVHTERKSVKILCLAVIHPYLFFPSLLICTLTQAA